MGQQLDLFTGRVSPKEATPAPEPPREEPLPPPEVLPGQIGLFDFRGLALGRARAAMAEGRLEEACRELSDLAVRLPNDAAVLREGVEVRALMEKLARIAGPRRKQRGRALLALAGELEGAPEPRASLRRLLLLRAAAELIREQGDAGTLEGRLAGEILIDAGALAEAEVSLAAALAACREARALYRLADAILLRGDTAAARRRYREALLVDPFDAALLDVRDAEVRALPGVVRLDLEIDDDPEAWAAPAGIITGVLPWPARGEAAAAPGAGEDAMSPERREALGRARGFVEALAATGTARGDAAITVRREMKRLSAAMFEVYMDRVVRGRG
jgi:tetratricopeptide (TPR) repeat protein